MIGVGEGGRPTRNVKNIKTKAMLTDLKPRLRQANDSRVPSVAFQGKEKVGYRRFSGKRSESI